MFAIKHINGMFDLFSGIGYDTHTRIQRTKLPNGNVVVRYLSGQRLPGAVCKALVANLDVGKSYQTLEI